MNKIIAYGIKVEGLDKTINTYGELLDLIKDSREELRNVNPEKDGPASRRALERYAAAKEAQKQFNATVRETQKTLAAAGDDANGSYRQLQNTMSVLKRDFKELPRIERQGDTGRQLATRIKEISNELKEADSELGDFFRNVGDYENSIFSAFERANLAGLVKGDLSGLSGLPGIIKDTDLNLGSLTEQAKLFGPALALGAIVQGAQVFLNVVSEALNRAKQAKALVSVTGGVSNADLNTTTAELIATSELFGESNERVFESANALAKQFNISLEDSSRLLGQAAIATGPLSGEILDVAREYPTFFKELGLSADQFLAIASKQIKDGIFSDKGIDAIKEAAIQLRELPKPAEEAINALGISTEDAQKIRATDGVLGLLDEVLVKFREIDPESQLAGQVLADIFKGAGEDAGADFIKTLDLSNTSLEALTDSSNRYVKQQQIQLDQQRELALLQAEIEGQVGDTAFQFEILKERASGEILKIFRDILVVSEGIGSAFDSVASAFSGVGDQVDELSEKFPILSKSIRRIGTDLLRPLQPLESLREASEFFLGRAETEGSSAFGTDLFETSTEPTNRLPGEGFGVLAPRGVVAGESTEEATARKKREEAAKKADELAKKSAEQRAKEAAAARKALTGLKKIQAEILEINAEIATFTGDAAALNVLNAQAEQLKQLEVAMRENGLRLVGEAQSALPRLDEELDSLYQSLAAPGADFEAIFKRIIEVNQARASLVQRLSATQDGLATPEQILALDEQVQFLLAERNTISPIAQSTGQSVASEDDPLAQAAEQARAQQLESGNAFVESQKEQMQNLQNAYRSTASIASRAFSEFFASGERDAESFSRALANAVISSLDPQIQALAFKAGVNTAATIPGPAGIIAGGLVTATLTAGWEALKGSLQTFEKGGPVRGARHSGGGVKAELEGGEFVMNRRAMKDPVNRAIVSKMNKDAGGRGYGEAIKTFSGARLFMEQGGSTPFFNSTSTVGVSELSDSAVTRIADAVREGALMGTESGSSTGTARGVVLAEDLKIQKQPQAI